MCEKCEIIKEEFAQYILKSQIDRYKFGFLIVGAFCVPMIIALLAWWLG
jgi:hypothetical protein